jgi:hypothetical protein
MNRIPKDKEMKREITLKNKKIISPSYILSLKRYERQEVGKDMEIEECSGWCVWKRLNETENY